MPRADDREQVVINRLKVYRAQTEPLVRYYGERPTYCRIDGARLPDDVTDDVFRAVEAVARAGQDPGRDPGSGIRDPKTG